MNKILITGGSGLIGSLLNNHLKEKYNLINLDIKKPTNHSQDTIIGNMNVLEDVKIASKSADAIIHLGAVINVDSDWELVLKNNIESTRNVYEAAKINGVKKVIFASSNHAVGLFENDSPYKEIVKGDYEKVSSNYKLIKPNCEVRPDSLYGVSKAYGENLGRFYYEKYGIEVACLRIGSVIKNNTPVVKNSNRFFSTWCSHNDIAGLIEACIDSERVRFEIFYGVSNNKWKIWDISNFENKLSFYPKSNAEDLRYN